MLVRRRNCDWLGVRAGASALARQRLLAPTPAPPSAVARPLFAPHAAAASSPPSSARRYSPRAPRSRSQRSQDRARPVEGKILSLGCVCTCARVCPRFPCVSTLQAVLRLCRATSALVLYAVVGDGLTASQMSLGRCRKMQCTFFAYDAIYIYFFLVKKLIRIRG